MRALHDDLIARQEAGGWSEVTPSDPWGTGATGGGLFFLG